MKHNRYVLIVNMGNYTLDSGGTNKVVFSQQALLDKNKISIMCIYPYKRIKDSVYWGLLIDGKYRGITNSDNLLYKIAQYSNNNICLQQIIIHHLINIDLFDLRKIVKALMVDTRLYIHDFYTICPHRYLMIHSDGRQCKSNFTGDTDCQTCKYYEFSKDRADDIRDFIMSCDLIDTVVAPSEMALNQWRLAFPQFKGETKVIEHQKLLGDYNGNSNMLMNNDKIKIGFVGRATEEKGWNYWYNAITKIVEKNNNYEFHQFGECATKLNDVREHKVVFQDGTNAMSEALRDAEIDCVVLWSIVKETYSYTYFEAWSSNAYILTNQYSGNIALQVLKNGNGMVANNPHDLIAILENEEELRCKINDYRRTIKNAPLILEENDLFIYDIPDNTMKYNFDKPKFNFKLLFKLYSNQIIAIFELFFSIMKRKIKRIVR